MIPQFSGLFNPLRQTARPATKRPISQSKIKNGIRTVSPSGHLIDFSANSAENAIRVPQVSGGFRVNGCPNKNRIVKRLSFVFAAPKPNPSLECIAARSQKSSGHGLRWVSNGEIDRIGNNPFKSGSTNHFTRLLKCKECQLGKK
jgi:hypothetical protein